MPIVEKSESITRILSGLPDCPTDKESNSLYRQWINERASTYKDFAYALCYKISQDSPEALMWWVNTFGKAFDPRVRGSSSHTDMIAFPRQEEFFRFMYRKVVVENESWGSQKSRGFGLSVALVDFFGWRWLWDENAHSLLVSRVDALVDSKNPDSLFWKLDYQLDSLPEWQKNILIPGVEFRLGTQFRSKNILIHPLTAAAINGEATTGNVGRGGRKWAGAVDEAGAIAFLDAVRTSLSGATDCVGYVSTDTPEGPDFTAMHEQKKVEFFPGGASWRDNPMWRGYTDKATGVFIPGELYVCERGCKAHPDGGATHSDRFDKKVAEFSVKEIAQEFEMDAAKAGGAVFNVERVRRCIDRLERAMADGSLRFDHLTLEFVQPDKVPVIIETEQLYRERGKWPVRPRHTPGGYLQIWKWPFSCRDKKCVCEGSGQHVYTIGADTSSGYSSSDPCGAAVWDATVGEHVAMLYGQFDATTLGEEVVKLAKFYGTSSGDDIDAWTGIESNNEGATVNRIASQHGLLLHISRSDDRIRGSKQENRLGVRVTRANRASMLAENIEHEINGGVGDMPALVSPFLILWLQCRTFIEYAAGSKQGVQKPESTKKAAQNKHKDDVIFCINHALYVARTRYGAVRGILRPKNLRYRATKYVVYQDKAQPPLVHA